jgi:hypothetical protein
LPIGPLGDDLSRSAPLVLAVVPLDQIRIDLRNVSIAGERAGPERALQGAAKDLSKLQLSEPLSEVTRGPFSALSQGQIRPPGMLPREAPGRLTMSGQIDDWQRVSHMSAPRQVPLDKRRARKRSRKSEVVANSPSIETFAQFLSRD